MGSCVSGKIKSWRSMELDCEDGLMAPRKPIAIQDLDSAVLHRVEELLGRQLSSMALHQATVQNDSNV